MGVLQIHAELRGSRVSEFVRNPEDLQVIALDIDDDVGRIARGSILDVEFTSRIQRADEGTVLGRTGHNRDHAAHWRIGRADQNISTGASGIWISDAPDDGLLRQRPAGITAGWAAPFWCERGMQALEPCQVERLRKDVFPVDERKAKVRSGSSANAA